MGQIPARNGVPYLAAIDPIAGQPVRSSRRSETVTNTGTEAMIHVDIRKLGPIPPGAAVARPRVTTPSRPGTRSWALRRRSRRWTYRGEVGHLRVETPRQRECGKLAKARSG